MEQFYFVLTERCNLSCSHCIRDSSPYRDETSEFALVASTLRQIREHHPETTVLLSGGEPTLYRRFDDILNLAVSLGFRVNVNSNGATSFFRQEQLSRLVGCRGLMFQISLDGPQPMHDAIRGPGTYARSIRSIGRLAELGIRCSVSTVAATNDFLEHAFEFLRDLDDLGLNHIAVKRVTHAGRASSAVAIDSETWNLFVDKVRESVWRTRIIATPMYDFRKLESLTDEALHEFESFNRFKNCGAGREKVYIYTNGDVCPCTCFKTLPMGNLTRQPLHEILKNKPTFKVSHASCKSCRYLKLCNGGCLGSGFNASGILGTPDPRCPRVARASPFTEKQ